MRFYIVLYLHPYNDNKPFISQMRLALERLRPPVTSCKGRAWPPSPKCYSLGWGWGSKRPCTFYFEGHQLIAFCRGLRGMEKGLAKLPCPSDIREGRPRPWMLWPLYTLPLPPSVTSPETLERLYIGVVTLVVPTTSDLQ